MSIGSTTWNLGSACARLDWSSQAVWQARKLDFDNLATLFEHDKLSLEKTFKVTFKPTHWEFDTKASYISMLDNMFWQRDPIFSKHMSIWCPFLVPQLATHHSNITIWLTKMTMKGMHAHLNQLNKDEIIALKCAIRWSRGNSSIPKYFEHLLTL